MIMATPKKKNVRDMSTTLKACSTDPDYLRALEIIERSEKFAYKNNIQD